ncbi:MAG: GTP 3',8-cyclase MoaA [Methanobacteriota archaeon]
MLVDPFGRPITDLRISVTDRCNFGCVYCHNEGQGPVKGPSGPQGSEMTVDEVARIVHVGREFGVRAVKLTGGEPLLRSDLEEMVRRFPRDVEVSVTTNGSMLAKRAAMLKAAGVARLNVSVDTLDPRRFKEIRRGSLDPVLEGIHAGLAAGLAPVKINMVVFSETLPYVEQMVDAVALTPGLELQLIEYMPELTGHPEWRVDIASVHEWLAKRAASVVHRDMHNRARYQIGNAVVEVVDPVGNEAFCAACHRLRVTADGHLKGCLNRVDDLVPTRGLDEEGIRAAFRRVVAERMPYYPNYMGRAGGPRVSLPMVSLPPSPSQRFSARSGRDET